MAARRKAGTARCPVAGLTSAVDRPAAAAVRHI